jgi:hypothetical protein
MKITGIVTLLDKYGAFLRSQKYYNKKNREQIINKWRILYPKNKLFILIKPDIDDKD